MPKKRKTKSGKQRSSKKTLGLLVIIIVILAVGIVVFSGINPLNPQQSSIMPVIVVIQKGASLNVRLGFSPAFVKVVIGVNNTIIWRNEDTDDHTAHSNIPEFDSKIIPPGASFTHTFQRSGSYPYHCDPHPWMTGLVTVIASGSNPIFEQSPSPLQITWQLLAEICDGIEL